MSVRLMSWAMEQSLPPFHRFILVVLADHCGEDATCFPSIKRIHRKTGISERTIQRCLRDMEASEVVTHFKDDKGKWTFRVNHDLALVVTREELRGKGAAKRLTEEAVTTFEATCFWCARQGTEKLGPDRKPWTLALLEVGKSCGKYHSENIVLSCLKCREERKAKPQLEFEAVLGKPLPKRKRQVTAGHQGGDTESGGGCQPDTRGVSPCHPHLNHQRETSAEPKRGDLFEASESLPPPLNTPEIEAAWETWQANLVAKKKRLTPISRKLQIKKMLEIGPERSLAALEHSARNNYAGLFEPNCKDAPARRVKKAITEENAL